MASRSRLSVGAAGRIHDEYQKVEQHQDKRRQQTTALRERALRVRCGRPLLYFQLRSEPLRTYCYPTRRRGTVHIASLATRTHGNTPPARQGRSNKITALTASTRWCIRPGGWRLVLPAFDP